MSLLLLLLLLLCLLLLLRLLLRLLLLVCLSLHKPPPQVSAGSCRQPGILFWQRWQGRDQLLLLLHEVSNCGPCSMM
jgi:hypothetical protein